MVYLLCLFRVPHGRLKFLNVALVAFLSGEEEANLALVGGDVPAVVEHN